MMAADTNLSYVVQRLRCYMVPDRRKRTPKKGSAETERIRALIAKLLAAGTTIASESDVAPSISQKLKDNEDRVLADPAFESLFDQVIDEEGADDQEEPGDEEEDEDDDAEEALAPPKSPIGERVFEIGRPYQGYCLIFDCETTTDTDQELRFGAYQVRGIPQQKRMEFAEEGELTPERIEELRRE
jgi:hypothetical protein